MTAARIDLHNHTSHSEDRFTLAVAGSSTAILPFHPLLEPCAAYDLALQRGMTHVTFTDHDTISGGLELLERHPDPSRFILGEELTCYFSDKPLHIGIYGLTEADHKHLHAGAERSDRERVCLRWHLPELVAYLTARRLVFVLNHPLWAPDGRSFTRDEFIWLFESFPLIEGINGTRHRWLNQLAVRLALRFGGPNVAFCGGSDSHTDKVGRCHTVTEGETVAEVLDSLRAGNCRPAGPPGTHRLLEDDTRLLINHNAMLRAGGTLGLLGDQIDELPTIAKDLLAVVLTGTLFNQVVQEFVKQRALARSVEALFAADLAEGASNGQGLVRPAPDRVVHGHVRRD